MYFTAAQVQFLRHLANEEPSRKSPSQAAEFFSQDQGIGVRMHRHFEYGARDFQAARQLLNNHGLGTDTLPAGSSRAQAQVQPGLSEKTGTLAPHAHAVAVKTAHGQCRYLDDVLPRHGYGVFTPEQVADIEADCVLWVENFETFRWLERNRWIAYQGRNVLAMYRGDSVYALNHAQAALAARTDPVWAYMDFDPAGLAMAAALPRLERLLLPPAPALAQAVKKAQQRYLYTQQLPQYRAVLNRLQDGPVLAAWQQMQTLQAGIVQEWLDGWEPDPHSHTDIT